MPDGIELLRAFVELSTENLDRVLSDLSRVEAQAISATQQRSFDIDTDQLKEVESDIRRAGDRASDLAGEWEIITQGVGTAGDSIKNDVVPGLSEAIDEALGLEDAIGAWEAPISLSLIHI